MQRIVRASLLVLAGAVPALAQAPIVVDLGGGGDHTSLQAALDAAPPGATILVLGGTHPVVRVTKPVTLLADPPAAIVGGALSGNPPIVRPCVELDGPGAGRVVLSGWDLSGTADGAIANGIRAAIEGGGFDALYVLDSDVAAATWFHLTGYGDGAPGIEVDVPLLWVERSSVTGNEPGTDWPIPLLAFAGPAGIEATGTAVVLDSTVSGGNGMTVAIDIGAPLPSDDIGPGGPGVVAASVFHANSTIVGGKGGAVREWDPGQGFGPVLGFQPDGAPIDASSALELADDFAIDGELRGGGALDVAFEPALAPGFLAISLPASPWLPDLGPLFLEPAFAPLLLPVGAAAFALPLPPDVGPVGTAYAFQQIGVAPFDVSRPIVRLVVP